MSQQSDHPQAKSGAGQPDAARRATLSERCFRWFCVALVRVFYRRCEVAGLEHLPGTGPVLLCANHPSALMDFVVIQYVSKRVVHPMARSGLFRNPLLRPLLAVIQAVPVYRRQDAGSDTVVDAALSSGRNQDAFTRCYELLGAGETLLVFPEGESHSDPAMRGFKTGAARLAHGALAANGRAPVLVPVGINFTDVGRFRSSVLLWVAPPLPVAARSGESSEDTVRRITDELQGLLAGTTLNLERMEDRDLLRRIERFFALRRGRARKRNLSERFRTQHKLGETLHRLRQEHPARLDAVMRQLGQFERLCKRFGVRDYQLTLEYTPGRVARFVARSLGVLLLALPLALWGVLNSGLPYALTGMLAVRTASDRYQFDTAKIGFGMLFFGVFWGGQTALVYLWSGAAAALYALSLPPSAALALFVSRERARIIDNVRGFFALVRAKQVRPFLEEKRTELEMRLARLAQLAKQPTHPAGERKPESEAASRV